MTFLVFFWASVPAVGQQLPTHPIKCANPLFARNSKGKKPLQDDLPANFTDSLPSPSGRFMIYYDAANSNPDSNTAFAFVQRAAEEADSAYEFEMLDLGYDPPQFTNNGHYSIFLTPLHSGDHAYGETRVINRGQLANSPSGNERWRSFIEVDNAFTDHSIYATLGFDALRVTIFHEFFHMTQFSGYGVPPQLSLIHI